MLSRRQFHAAAAYWAAAAFGVARTGASEANPLPGRIEKSLTAAAEFLAAQQGDDGAWRSTTYGPLKDGPSLTATIAATLASCRLESSGQSLPKARQYLARLITADGHVAADVTLAYPVYAAAGAVVALSHSPAQQYQLPRAAWIAHLRSHQLVESLGWQPADPAYGGWSYAHEPPTPVLGRPASPLAEPNLSATVFAIDALRAAGYGVTDPALQSARIFIERCQNWPADSTSRDTRYDDGGFCFILDDPVRNKAGQAGADAHGRMRYKSYGSATADGLRALLACGLAADHPRVAAARRWLSDHFSAQSHPGDYPKSRGHLREAVYYYYSASVARAFTALERHGRESSDLPPSCLAALAEELLRRQNADGAWSNPAVDTREDDPLVATPLAMRALLECLQA